MGGLLAFGMVPPLDLVRRTLTDDAIACKNLHSCRPRRADRVTAPIFGDPHAGNTVGAFIIADDPLFHVCLSNQGNIR